MPINKLNTIQGKSNKNNKYSKILKNIIKNTLLAGENPPLENETYTTFC